MCLWIFYVANSATSLASFLLGAVVFIAGRTFWAGAGVRSTVRGLIVVGLSAGVALWIPELREFVTRSMGRDPTLTTRTDIWTAVLGLPTDPLFGSGFASVWLTPEGWASNTKINIPHAHNGYLETYLNGGIVGVALLLAVLLMAAVQAGRHLAAKTAARGVLRRFCPYRRRLQLLRGHVQ